MYTGIVRGRGAVAEVIQKPGLTTLHIECPADLLDGIELGASVAADGVCLTCTRFISNTLVFDVMLETLRRTNLGLLRKGDEVNLERSARDGAEIGGHPLSGHIDDMVEISRIEYPENNCVMTFSVSQESMRYIFPKGYVALNGTSLTVAAVDRASRTFQVWFIPETLIRTTFGSKKTGDKINLEIERGTQVTVDTIRNFLEERFASALPELKELLENTLAGNVRSLPAGRGNAS